MLRKYAPIMAAVMILMPFAGAAHVAWGTYLDQLGTIRPVARWAPEPLELVMLGACLAMLCLIAPSWRKGLQK